MKSINTFNQVNVWFCALALLLTAFTSNASPKSSKTLPARYHKAPLKRVSLSVGSPNAGWQRRAMRLKPRRYLRVKSALSRRNYGHPTLVKMLRRSARAVSRTAPGSVLLVGDLSKKHGGAISGHRSHQSGRDADIGFYARTAAGKPHPMRRFVAFDSDGLAIDGSGVRFDDARNWMLIRALLGAHRARLQHIFVSTPLRARLLAYARRHESDERYIAAAELLLRQPGNALPHDDHFHVRIGCPRGQSDVCTSSAAPVKNRR